MSTCLHNTKFGFGRIGNLNRSTATVAHGCDSATEVFASDEQPTADLGRHTDEPDGASRGVVVELSEWSVNPVTKVAETFGEGIRVVFVPVAAVASAVVVAAATVASVVTVVGSMREDGGRWADVSEAVASK